MREYFNQTAAKVLEVSQLLCYDVCLCISRGGGIS